MLNEEETKQLIENEKARHSMIVDEEQREKHRHYILGMECVYNE